VIDWCRAICPAQSKPCYIVDIVQKVFIGSKYELTLTPMPWPRAIDEVTKGDYHALLAPVKIEAPQLIYPDNEVGVQKTCFYTDKSDLWNFDGIKSLQQNRMIAMVKGNYLLEYDNFVRKNPKIFRYITYKDYLPRTIKMINSKRLNTFVYTKTEGTYYLKNNNFLINIKMLGELKVLCFIWDSLQYIGNYQKSLLIILIKRSHY
jgi:hypothetical protein